MIKDIDDYIEGLEVRPKFILNINELRNLKNQCEECIKNISKYKEEELLKIYYLNGLIYRSLEKGEEAINCFEKVAVIAKTINNEIWQARAYSSISLVYSKKNDIHNSKKYFDKAFNLIKLKYTLEETLIIHIQNILKNKYEDFDRDLFRKEMDRVRDFLNENIKKEYGYLFIILGSRYTEIFDDYREAMKCFLKALKIGEEYGVVEVKCIVLYYISISYYDGLHKSKEAIRYLEPLVYNIEYKNIMNINLRSSSTMTLIECYLDTENFDNIDRLFKDVMDNVDNLSEFVKNSMDAMIFYLRSRISFTRDKNYEVALEEALEAEKLYLANEKTFAFTHFDYNIRTLIGDIYFKLEEYKKGIDVYRDTIEISKIWGSLFELNLYEKLAESYEAIGDYNKSLEYYKKYDELFSNEARYQDVEYMHKVFEKDSKEEKIKELYDINGMMKKEIYIDGLTKIYNRTYLNNLLEKHSGRHYVSIMMMDIDYFKKYNDNYGHIMGDKVLESVARTIKKCCNLDEDKIIRYGGEEFLIISYNEDSNYLKEVKKRIESEIYNLNIEHRFSLVSDRISISMGDTKGIINSKDDYINMINIADEELYKAKRKRLE